MPQKHKSCTHMLLPPSTFNWTTMRVNIFLCHTVAPDETWELVVNVGKWQWDKVGNWGSPHPKKFGQNPEGSQWWWLSHMILIVLPSTIQSQKIKMWNQSTITRFWRIICNQQSYKSNHISVQVLHHLWCTKMHTAMWQDLGLGFTHSISGYFKHLSYFPSESLWL